MPTAIIKEAGPCEIFPAGCIIGKEVSADQKNAGRITAEIFRLVGLPAGGNICRECGETVLCRARRAS